MTKLRDDKLIERWRKPSYRVSIPNMSLVPGSATDSAGLYITSVETAENMSLVR